MNDDSRSDSEPSGDGPDVTASSSAGQAPAGALPSLVIENKTAQGILLMVLGVGALSLNDAFMKWVVDSYPVGPAIFVRNLLSLLCIVAVVAFQRRFRELRWRGLKNQVVSAVYMIVSMAMFVYALGKLPLSMATIIIYVSPLIVTGLAPFLLGETVGWRRYAAVAVGFAGAVIVIQPGPAGLRIEVLSVLGAAIVIALRDMLTRRMIASETSYSIFAFSTLFGALVCFPWAMMDWKPVSSGGLLFLALSAISFTLAQLLMIEAFRRADASLASPFKYTGVLWAVIIGFFVWGDIPDLNLVLGGALIVASGIFIVLRERQLSRMNRL